MGESISEGSIASVLKKAGDKVEENETIAQIETDKVTIDVKSPTDGTLVGILVQQDDTVRPGQVVATVDDKAVSSNTIGSPVPSPPAPSAAPSPSEATSSPAASTATPAQTPTTTTQVQRFPLLESVFCYQ